MASRVAVTLSKFDEFFAARQYLPLQDVFEPWFSRFDVRLRILRADLVHPVVSGNKWFKLKYNLYAARDAGHDTLLSFGGAYSNHIHALAYAGRELGFNTIGVIRGEPCTPLNPTLRFATECGMRLTYLDRARYRLKNDPELMAQWRAQYGAFFCVPEGGSNLLAVRGCQELVAAINDEFDVLACACGTGGTLAGLVAGTKGRQRVLGVSVLKGGEFLRDAVDGLVREATGMRYDNWSMSHDYHGGGYARMTVALERFITHFEARHAIPLDPVYTGKLMFGLYDLIGKGCFAPGATIVALHSGGLQGKVGFAPPEEME